MRRNPAQPVLVGQLTAIKPGGGVDTASTTDCGESCCASVHRTYSGLFTSPGCVRQSLGLPMENGTTTASDLARYLIGVGFAARISGSNGPRWAADIRRELFHRRYVIALGHWQGPAELHWVLAYHAGRHNLWVMDPWVEQYVPWPWAAAAGVQAGSHVAVSGR